MATKKTPKKIMTVPMPKPQAPRAADMVVASLMSLEASQGWAVIVKILNDNISYLEKAILDKVDPVSLETLSEAEVEIARVKRKLNIDLRDTPANYAKVVKETDEVPEEFDPYFKTNDDIKKARNPIRDDGR